jgi:hypothetical protein
MWLCVPWFPQVVGDDEEGGDADVDDGEDDAYLEAADKFEAAYNFRRVHDCCVLTCLFC